MDRGVGPDPFAGLKDSTEEYGVYDIHYEKIGKVDDVFLDERDAVSYIGVKMGFFDTSTTLVPAEIVRVNDRRLLIEIDAEAETIKHAPHFGHEETVSPELEDRVRTYFGLAPLSPLPPGEPHPTEDPSRFAPDYRVDIEPGERMEAQDRLAGTAPGETPPPDERLEAEERWDRETKSGFTLHRRRR